LPAIVTKPRISRLQHCKSGSTFAGAGLACHSWGAACGEQAVVPIPGRGMFGMDDPIPDPRLSLGCVE
jgi:hypothetical protein